jgi:subtilisin-like proprotein convertase family protein
LASQTQITSIGSLSVGLDITHAAPSQLRAYLVAPAGNSVTLFENPSSIDPTYEDVGFVGQGLVGTWTLQLYDDIKGVVGTLNEWSITVTQQLAGGAGGAAASSATDVGVFLFAPTLPSGSSSDEVVSPASLSESEADAADTVFSVDETTFFATPSDPAATPSATAAAVDAAIESLDVDSLSEDLEEELATGLL